MSYHSAHPARLSAFAVLDKDPESGLAFRVYLHSVLDDVAAVDDLAFAICVHSVTPPFCFALRLVRHLPPTANAKPGGRTPG